MRGSFFAPFVPNQKLLGKNSKEETESRKLNYIGDVNHKSPEIAVPVSNVVVVIQKDNSRITYKMVTVYPDKKGN